MSSPNADHAAPVKDLPRASIRPADPFALNCRFDRARGEFVVRAGARAGACAALAMLVLALGTTAFIRSCFQGLSGMASAAPVVLAPPAVNAYTGNESAGTVSDPATSAPLVTATPQPGRAADAASRRAGLNYLVLKSVPSERAALAARDALAAKGVAATVERKLPGWSGKGWYSLVGTTGYDLDRDRAAFDRHVRELKTLKHLKLDPKPYKWHGTEVAAAR